MELDINSTERMELVARILNKVYKDAEWGWSSYNYNISGSLDEYDYDLLKRIVNGE